MKLRQWPMGLAGSVLAGALAVFGLTGNAFAQQAPNAGSVLNSTRESPQDPRQSPDVLNNAASAAAAAQSAPDGGATVQVTGFRFSGNDNIPTPELLAQLKGFIGKPAGLKGLEEAADTVRDYYRDHHFFLAQVFVPPQKISDGVVELHVLEGRIGTARVIRDPSARLRDSVAQNYLDALTPAGSAITETRIEKPLLLINDLPGVVLHSTLKPGADPGSADLEVNLADDGKKFGGNVQLDNLGNRNTGRGRALVQVNGRDLTGYGDLLSLRGLVSQAGETKLGDGNYTIPVGPYGTKVTAGYTSLTYKLGGTFANQNADGNAQIETLALQHPFVRSRNFNLFASLGYQHKDLEDRLFNGANVQKHRIDAAYAGVVGDGRDPLLGGALNSFDLTLNSGRLSNPAGSAQDVYHTAGSYTKVQADLRRLQNVATDTTVLLALSGQAANHNLTSSEKLSLGGPDAVRAHPVGESAGDDVAIGTVELRRVIPALHPLGGTLQFNAFYDAGYSELNHQPLATDQVTHRFLQGFGFGANLGRQDDFLIKLEVAFRCGEKSTDDDSDSRIWARAIKWF